MKRREFTTWPLHPFLFGAYTVLFLYSQNVGKVEGREVIGPIAMILLASAALLGLFRLALGNWRKAGLLVTVLSFLFFSYGHVFESVRAQSIAGRSLGSDTFWLIAWVALAVAGLIFVIRSREGAPRLTSTLNLIFAGLVSLALLTVVVGRIQLSREAPVVGAQALDETGAASAAQKRDIYYIILDRYAGWETLQEVYNYDNKPFLDALRARGFYVAMQARGNYPKTPHAISTSLNMEYLDELPEESSDWRRVYTRLQDPRSAAFLKNQGYEYFLFGSGYHALRKDPSADKSFVYDENAGPVWNGFTRALYDSTVLSAVGARWNLEPLDTRRTDYGRPLYQFQTVPEIKKNPDPTFTFAHIEVTHPPFVFDADGSYLTKEQEEEKPFEEAYTDTVRFASKKTIELLDKLLDVPEAQKPIIILQSDEGPGPKGWRWNWPPHYDWTTASQETLDEKFRILNAYHLPGVDHSNLYPSISPVNSFRIVFNLYFDADLPLLPDESYVFRNELEPYRFIRVTERVKG